jgi:hypothetical protein
VQHFLREAADTREDEKASLTWRRFFSQEMSSPRFFLKKHKNWNGGRKRKANWELESNNISKRNTSTKTQQLLCQQQIGERKRVFVSHPSIAHSQKGEGGKWWFLSFFLSFSVGVQQFFFLFFQKQQIELQPSIHCPLSEGRR